MNVLWRIRTGGGDRTITADATERDSYPLDGAIFYVPKKEHLIWARFHSIVCSTATTTWCHSILTKARLRAITSREFWVTPSISQQAGTSELIRTYSPSTGHHSLRNSTGLETEKGYVDQPLGVYGYPRYYNEGRETSQPERRRHNRSLQ